MRLWMKIAGSLAAVVLSVLGGASLYWGVLLPRTAPPSKISVPVTPERLARGEYIFETLADCNGCHSQRDFTRFGGPVVPGRKGMGQEIAGLKMPGRVVAPNITPDRETGIGAWTDGEKIRAIREGIDREGRVLFPLMPYKNFRNMSDYDVESLVAYLNSLPPAKNKLPQTQIDFPVSLFIRSAPEPVGSVTAPTRGKTVEYGEYLVTIGDCKTCHTQDVRGQLLDQMSFAGGREFRTPVATVVSANISPDPDTGIGGWSESYFQERFVLQRTYVHNGSPKIGPGQFTLMPWLSFSQMDADDLSAIYKYLQSQPAIKNKVEKHPGFTQRAGMERRDR